MWSILPPDCAISSTLRVLERCPPMTRLDSAQEALQGQVLNPKRQPSTGIRGELDNPRTAIPVTSTYAQPDGRFAIQSKVIKESSLNTCSRNTFR
jgi:hypothetical protein